MIEKIKGYQNKINAMKKARGNSNGHNQGKLSRNIPFISNP
jgi:hypothetical protein